MKVKVVPKSDCVQVEENSRPKLTYQEDKMQAAENNPLFEHFYAYLGDLLSQALDPGFLESVYAKKESTYMVPIEEVEKVVKQKIDQLDTVLCWNTEIKVNV